MPTAGIAPVPLPLRHISIDIPFSMEIDLKGLSATLALEPEKDGRWFELRDQLAHLGLEQGFDELIGLNHCTDFEPLWHQTETVRKVLKRFRGRVLLADEVGLGKTIEACMVLSDDQHALLAAYSKQSGLSMNDVVISLIWKLREAVGDDARWAKAYEAYQAERDHCVVRDDAAGGTTTASGATTASGHAGPAA